MTGFYDLIISAILAITQWSVHAPKVLIHVLFTSKLPNNPITGLNYEKKSVVEANAPKPVLPTHLLEPSSKSTRTPMIPPKS